jgi:amino acid adenylation domain-containing protein
MKTTDEFLSYLRHLDVKLWSDGDRLRYSAPNGTLTLTLLQELREHKSEILAFLQKTNLALNSNFDDLRPVPRNVDLPLSFAQQRLWFLNQLEGGSAYNTPVALQLTGYLQVAVLERSLTEIVRRHEALRTNFAGVDGSPMQVIYPPTPVTLAIINLQALPKAEQSLEVQRLACEEAQYLFDLTQDSLLRTTLLQLSDQKYVLLLMMHHIVFDGWSTGILLGELSTLYEAFSQGEPSPLPDLPIQYADFAVWQRQWLSGEVLETQLNYWKQQLAGAPPLLELPTDRPRPSVQTYRGNTYEFQLNADLSQKLKSLSQKLGATLFMTLLTAFNILLSRYSGQSDIIVGSPIANRNHSEIESLIGFFVNTLVLRTNLEGNPSFVELLSRVRQVALDAYAHQDLPIERLVEELQPERSLSYSPLFQVMFALQNASIEELGMPGLSITSLQLENVTSKFDLSLSMEETAQQLRGAWEYNIDLFDVATITRMTGHFQTLLEGIVGNPEQEIFELPLLTSTERYQLLEEWNNTQTEYSQHKCIHQLFQDQVELTPDAVAIVFEDQQLTYRELNARANKLAHYLRTLGVGSEVLVGLCAERSLDMVVGLLGILKAGGAYLPLDPNYPQERLTFMLSDSQVSILLTKQNFISQLLEHKGRAVCLDTDWEVISQHRDDNLSLCVQPCNLAYVIYTSGSTGQPKGVIIKHSSLVNFTEAAKVEYELSECDRVLQFASISFDAAVEEIYPCLTSGGTLVLRTNDMLSSVPEFLNKCRELQLTVLDLPTAYWHQLIYELVNADVMLPESLRLVIIGGEQALPEQVRVWQKRIGAIPRLVNTYGPTEATVVTTLCTLPSYTNLKLDGQKVPIGRPISNVQTYILDRYLQPVPIGVPGELYIGGAGLARGYLNARELTQEKFIPNPLGQEEGACLYKTGDLVRYLTSGNIEYLGRFDNQVKIRGFRIELGEIEAVLGKHRKVQQAVVIVREDIPGNKRLVTYVVAKPELVPTDSELRNFLKQKLPDYMIPNAFVMLPSLPLSPNGKVDRRALPAPDASHRNLETGFVAPRIPTEEILAAIWSEVLGLQHISIHDNFFELGGHSLLATQVISRLRKAFCVDLPLRSLFETPTIAKVAQKIEIIRKEVQNVQAKVIQPVSHDQDLPLSFAQQRLWFLDQLEGGTATYNMPIALQLSGSLQLTVLEQSLTEIVRRHEALRTTFSVVDGSPMQVIAPPTLITLPVVDLRMLPATEQLGEVQRLISLKAQRPFDLANDSLWRVCLIQLSEDDHVMLLVMHHIVSDGWSTGILLGELSTLYEAFSQGEPSPLPDLPIQYADFAVWQRQWLSGEVLETQLNYWKQQLAGAPPLLELPTDRPRPSVQTYRGNTYEFQLNADLSQKLKSLSQKLGATLFMTLLTAFNILLSRYSGQSDIIVGSPIANRNHSEIESLIGFFVNTLVLRTNLEGNPSFVELLSRVRQVALDAYAHQDLPIERLVEELQPERSLSYSPLFQVMFALQNASIEELGMPGLSITSLQLENVTSKFDLSLSMEETAQQLRGAWEYNIDLFDVATITRMTGHFQTLLEGIVGNPEQEIFELPLLTSTERYQLLEEWNNTQTEYSQHKCIHQLFQDQVELTPDAVAIVFEDQQLTYRELNCQANKVAHYLRTLGVGPDVLVGICLERSPLMVVALLGVLKAGGAYMPVDPTYPKERLTYMVENSQVSVLLTENKLVAELPKSRDCVVCLDTNWENIARESEENLLGGSEPENLGYVIYTSGSTGKPKGVMIAHNSLVNAYQGWKQIYQLPTLVTSHLQMASFSFDVFSGDVIRALCSGGKLVLCPHKWLLEPEKLYQLILHEEIDCAEFVPVVLRTLVQYLEKTQQNLNFMKLLIVGSDSLYMKEYEEFQRFCGPQTRLINSYGASEATIDSTFFERTKVNLTHNGFVPIGRPFPNTRIYILDNHLQPVPIGVAGELYIGGSGLARGYLNARELTQEKFIPNPLFQQAGTRLYKTGDKARYLVDGNIEYFGRSDNQVKIRGFRIELGEIEASLIKHPQVHSAAVIAREDIPGNKSLVAYVVAHQDSKVIIGELRSFLSSQMPTYMLPNAFVILETLPLTPNGKVDRRALPAPDVSHRNLETGFVAPRTSTEEILAAIWSEVLGLQHISIHDNFFELGGHSLLATQVISRLRKAFCIDLPLRSLFESPTIAESAELVVAQQFEQAESAALEFILAEVDELSDNDAKLLLAEYR